MFCVCTFSKDFLRAGGEGVRTRVRLVFGRINDDSCSRDDLGLLWVILRRINDDSCSNRAGRGGGRGGGGGENSWVGLGRITGISYWENVTELLRVEGGEVIDWCTIGVGMI